MWWVINTTPRPLYQRERDPVPIVQEAGWAPGPEWGYEKSRPPTEIRCPDRLFHTESLYLLLYPGPHRYQNMGENYFKFSFEFLG